jgi:GGDEF domain-containing protein
MSIISLRRYIDWGSDFETALRRVPFLLIEALALHVVECEAAERERFQISLRKLSEDLGAAKNAQTVLVTTGELIKTLESYNRSLERFWRGRGQELSAIITLLTKKLIGIADSSDTSYRKLAEIDKNLQSAYQIEDLRVLRAKLEDSLSGIRLESGRQASQAVEIRQEAQRLRKSIAQASAYSGPIGSGIDSVTGLPDRGAAQALLQQALEGKESCAFAALICVERLALINSRFGFAAGDSVLMLYAQHVAQRLGPDDHLFRWRGPSLLAVISASKNRASVLMEMRRIGSARFEHNVTIDGKAVLIPVTAVSLVAELREYDSVAALANVLDRFTSERSHDQQRVEN